MTKEEANLKIFMLWQLIGQVDSLMGAPLWYHYNAAYFFHLGVIWRTCAIEITSNLQRKKKSTTNK